MKKQIKIMKKQNVFVRGMALLAVLACAESSSKAINTIVHSELTSRGFILDSAGAVPAAGGITVGYFSSTVPSYSTIQSWTPGNAVANLVTAGYIDLRTVAGGQLQANFDWDWPGGGAVSAGNKVGGTLNWTYNAALAGKQLYLFAFNSGTSGTPFSATVQNTSSAFFTSSSFSGSTEWLAAKAESWLLPSNDSIPLNVNAIDIDLSSEMIVGTDGVSPGTTTTAILMIPEPSSASLLALGVAGLVALRVRRKS